MKKIFVLIAVVSVSIGLGCTKDKGCQEKTVASEEGAMAAYATSISMTPTRHSSGVYYQITNPGNSTKPTSASTIKFSYTGKFLNGTVFDQSTAPVTYPLADLIAGWRLCIPLIGEGGTIKLIVPSSLAYGCAGRSTIQPYSVLYFDIELVDVL